MHEIIKILIYIIFIVHDFSLKLLIDHKKKILYMNMFYECWNLESMSKIENN